MEKIDFEFGGRQFSADLRDDADRSVFNEIFKLREYRAADAAIKNAKFAILDVGAHAGFFSVYCFALNPEVKIFALEPESGNFNFLRKNLKINKIKTVKAEQAALAGETGRRHLEIAPDSHNHRLLNPREKSDKRVVEVKCYSFSEFCKKSKIKKISLLKMDIEGGESEIFSALLPADFSMVNFIILEYHNNSDCRKIEAKLRENGFGVQTFPSHFDKTMGFLFAHNKRQQALRA